MTQSRAAFGDHVAERVLARPGAKTDPLHLQGVFHVRQRRNGEVIAEWDAPNLITDQGINYIRNAAVLDDASPITAWYMLLLDDTPTVAGADTYSSHSGWAEEDNIQEANRPAWAAAAGATGVSTNTASPAEFTIDAGGATVGGVGIVGGGTDADTLGDTAGGGILLSAAAFSGGDRELLEDDVLEVTYSHTYARPA